MLQYVCLKVRRYLPTLFDVIRFIVEKDFPHSYPIFSSFVLKIINEIDLTDISILIFKQLKEVTVLIVRFFMNLEKEKV